MNRGDPVVWTKKHGKATSGLSEQHRVLDETRTLCMLEMPEDPKRFVDLGLPLAIEPCLRCEQRYAGGADLSSAFKSLLNDVRESAA